MKLFGFNILTNKTKELTKQVQDLENLKREVLALIEKSKKITLDIAEREESLEILKKEQSLGNPYLAKVISEYFHYRDVKTAFFLETKKYPARQASKTVKQISDENKDLIYKNKLLQNYINIYESLFPFIKKVQPVDIDFLLNNFHNENKIKEKIEELMQLSEKVDVNKINQLWETNIERINLYEKEMLDKIETFKNKQNEQLAIQEEESKKRIEQFTNENSERLKEQKSESIDYINQIKSNLESDVKQIIEEQSLGNPSLAKLISDFYFYKDLQIAQKLESKTSPAPIAAETVRETAKEKRAFKKENTILKNYIRLYESLFPFIKDLQPEDIDFLLKEQNADKDTAENKDPNKQLVPEYNRIKNDTERNQKALDRYIKKPKSNLEIGKMYERYIGYKYEEKGYDVEYFGIEKGVEDLGRDLICHKDGETLIVQCKNWASHKVIREAHINQLFGTTVKHYLNKHNYLTNALENTLFHNYVFSDDLGVKAVFITSTKLSDTAKAFAKALKIEVYENEKINDYPMIKCNLEEKIYHLPFDQQYDNMIMGKKYRKYVKTVEEAEELGCRRAYRWNPNN